MKIYSILCLSIAIVLPEMAVAKLPPNPAFGQLEGTIDYCAQVDAPSAAKYQDLKKRLVEDVEQKKVAEARKTKEYKESYDAMSEALGKVPNEQVIKACSSLLESKK
jgi:hypothetical protein